MRKLLKFNLPLLALTVAIFTIIAFTVHCDDTPFKYSTHSFVKQKISSSGPTSKIKIPCSAYVLGSALTTLNFNISSFRWNSGIHLQTFTSILAESVPSYRGPPIAIPA